MTAENRTSNTLLPCPFCGAGEYRETPVNYWTGMRNQVIAFEIRERWNKRI